MHNFDIIVHELTDHPAHSWPAHYDERRGRFYWGSDFLGEVLRSDWGNIVIDGCCKKVYTGSIPDTPIKEMVDHYLHEHMRVR